MSRIKKIINTANHTIGLECGVILSSYGYEGSIREDVELTCAERERLDRWCVIIEANESLTELEIQLAIAALRQAEEDRQYRRAVELDSYWSDQVVQAEIYDYGDEDQVRPRLVIISSPDYSGGCKQFYVDIAASIKHDLKNIACPLILPVIEHWQAYVRLFHHSEFHHEGREMYRIAKNLLERIAPTALESAIEQALPKEIAFQRILGFDKLGGRVLISGSDISEEISSLFFAHYFITEDTDFKAITSNDWKRECSSRFEALKQYFDARLDQQIKVVPHLIERYMQKTQRYPDIELQIERPLTEDELREQYNEVDAEVLSFFQENLEQYKKCDTQTCWLIAPPDEFDKLQTQYLSWRLRQLGANFKIGTVEKYFRDANRLYRGNWEHENFTPDHRLKRFDAKPLTHTFSLEGKVHFIHKTGSELRIYFDPQPSGQKTQATLLLIPDPRTE